MSTPVRFTASDRKFAATLKIALDDPPGDTPLAAEQRRSAHLLEAYERMEKECAQAHRDARDATAERDQARADRQALAITAVLLFAAWGFTVWMDGRIG